MLRTRFLKFCNRIMKRDIQFSDEIPTFYLLNLIYERARMLLVGTWKKIKFKRVGKIFFCGRNVQIKCPSKIIVGNSVTFKDGVKVDALSKYGVIIGDNVSIGENCRVMCSGSVSEIGKGVKIGDNTGIANDCFIGAAGGVSIGSNVLIGQNVRFHAENHEFLNTEILIKDQGVSHEGIKIGNDCWIGAGVVFLDGAEIGDGCVVGANAVVTQKFADNCVIAGVPAKIIKKRE